MAQEAQESRSDVILEVQGIWKAFPGVQALSDVSLRVRRGEIHAVVGENGAGKSTLMNILSGVYPADRGRIFLEGKETVPVNPNDAYRMGISIVHQETSLCTNLTVAENIFVHDMPTQAGGLIDRKRLHRQTQQMIDLFEIRATPETLVRDLSVGQQQLVEVAKATAYQCKVLILDEPTSALTDHEAAILFERARRMKKQGASVIYISHRLREVFDLADRVTILRDGRVVGTQDVAETDTASIVRMMVGREISQFYPDKAEEHGTPILQVRNLSYNDRFRDVSFDLHRGEILGVAGLIGAGRTEVALAIFGALPGITGEILLEGNRVTLDSPEKAIELGISYLPENRREEGLFLAMSVQANIISAHLGAFAKGLLMDAEKERQMAQRFVDVLSIRTPSLAREVLNLSGGNQQKVVVGKWLSTAPKILIADEPTRGIDVGSKAEIHELLRKLANDGMAILMISSELPEILGMSDRILVMHDGRLTGTLSAEEASEDAVMSLAIGS
ncbi:MAG: sugar ABC transporter ATP-binding protein [Chloroflexi bacterium]|nr:sugar ABC transporter ATP-binding protein [Chloroflexota bacterium]